MTEKRYRATDKGLVELTAEEVAEVVQREQEYAAEAARNAVMRQIAVLESTVTARRVREAVLTEAGAAWLANVDNQIAALRAQLA